MSCCGCEPIVGSGSTSPPAPPSGGPLYAVRFSQLPDQVLGDGFVLDRFELWQL